MLAAKRRYSMKDIFLWFYCLPIGKAIILVGLATIAYLWFHQWHRVSRMIKAADAILLACWLGIIVFATLGQRSPYDSSTAILLEPFHSYQEVRNGGNIELYRSNFMNVILFYPAGLLAALLLPRKWPGWCRFFLVVLVLAAMSAGIEFLQYRYGLGRCEIDDVIHNTAGALLGCLASLTPVFFALLKEKTQRTSS